MMNKITITEKDPKKLGIKLVDLMKKYKFDYFDFETIVDKHDKTTYLISLPKNTKLKKKH